MVKRHALALTLAVTTSGCLARPDDVPGGIEYTQTLAFGSLIGSTSYVQRVLLHNIGPGRTARLGMPQLVGPGAASFTIDDANECDGEVLELQGYCSVYVYFSAAELASVTAQLQIEAGNDGPLVAELVGSGTATPSFAASAPVSLPTTFGSLTLGDIDGDGTLDVAAGEGTDLMNNGATLTVVSSPSSPRPQAMALSDLDADGKVEMIGDFNTHVAVSRNVTTSPGTAAFSAPVDYGGSTPYAIAVADVDADSHPDIVAAGISTPVSVFTNQSVTGTITLEPPTDVTSYPVTGLDVGDVDADGKSDLVIITRDKASILLSASTQSAVSFPTEVTLPFDAGYFASQPKIGDLNGDGRADVAYFMTNSVRVAVNSAAGAPMFTERVDIPVSYMESGQRLELADFNRDGKLDIAVTMTGTTAVLLFLNATPAGARTPAFAPSFIAIGSVPAALAVGQLAGDAAPDVLVRTPSNKVITFVTQ